MLIVFARFQFTLLLKIKGASFILILAPFVTVRHFVNLQCKTVAGKNVIRASAYVVQLWIKHIIFTRFWAILTTFTC